MVRALPDAVGTVALVGHNPAFEEVVGLLTGHWIELKTSAIALVRLASWSAEGELVTHGRPPDR